MLVYESDSVAEMIDRLTAATKSDVIHFAPAGDGWWVWGQSKATAGKRVGPHEWERYFTALVWVTREPDRYAQEWAKRELDYWPTEDAEDWQAAIGRALTDAAEVYGGGSGPDLLTAAETLAYEYEAAQSAVDRVRAEQRALAERMVASGVAKARIAAALRVSRPTLDGWLKP